jgi:hypothetical protein
MANEKHDVGDGLSKTQDSTGAHPDALKLAYQEEVECDGW